MSVVIQPKIPDLSISVADLKALQNAGFSHKPPALKAPRIAAATEGKTKCGKTHFALYTPPEPLAFIMLDPGSLQLADKALAKGRKIFPKFIAHNKKASKDEGVALWKEFLEAVRLILQLKSIRTLVIDTITEAWELARIAYLGKLTNVKGIHYTEVNSAFSGLMNEIYYTRPDLNLILIQKVKKQYVKSGSGDNDMGNWDGKSYEAQGYGELEYLVDVSLVHGFNKSDGFFFTTKDSEATRFGPEFSGLKFKQSSEECSFLDLATHIFKDEAQCKDLGYDPIGADPEYWGMKF
jgi:hypothetical protein